MPFSRLQQASTQRPITRQYTTVSTITTIPDVDVAQTATFCGFNHRCFVHGHSMRDS